MEARIDRETSPAEAGIIWTTTYVLMGLRYERAVAQALLRGVLAMKESSTYQAILEEGEELGRSKGKIEGKIEGRIDEGRNILLRLGMERFSAPDGRALESANSIRSIERLEELACRVLHVQSWDELLS